MSSVPPAMSTRAGALAVQGFMGGASYTFPIMTSCPKCGRAVEPAARICPGCGVIMAKVRSKSEGASADPSGPAPRPPGPPRARPAPAPVPPPIASSEADDHASPQAAMLKVGLATAAGLVALLAYQRMRPKPAETPLLPPA